MIIWCNVYDPTYTVKRGQIFPVTASFSRKLDDAGSGTARFAIDPQSLSILRGKQIIEIWFSELKLRPDGAGSLEEHRTARKVGAFIIESVRPDDRDRLIAVSGPGVMVKLADKIILPGTKYENVNAAAVLTDLANKAGWAVQTDAALLDQYISVRLDKENVLRAMQVVCQFHGLHLRNTETINTIAAGSFGTNQDTLVIEYIEHDTGEAFARSDSSLLLERIEIIEEFTDVVNRAFVYGGGDGDAALTLEGANRNFIDSVNQNGRDHYYIQDAGSIARYGLIEMPMFIKRITPTDATESAVQFAKNALADAGLEALRRRMVPYEKYKLAIRQPGTNIQPGDKVRLNYAGIINRFGVPYQWRNIADDFWVLRVNETIMQSGVAIELEVANVDRYQASDDEIVLGMADAINVQNVNIQPYPAPYGWGPFQNPIDTETDVTLQFPVFPNVVNFNSAKIYIIRDYWTAVAGAANQAQEVQIEIAAHRHKVTGGFTKYGATAPPGTNYFQGQMLHGELGSGVTFMWPMFSDAASYPNGFWTWEAGGGGSFTIPELDLEITFDKVERDTVLPQDLTVIVDGTEIASGLFSDALASNQIVEVDATSAIKGRGDPRGWHDVVIQCGTGHGDLIVVLQIDVDVTRFRT